jgi:Zn-dependent protease
MSDATADFERAAADIPLTRDAREILERAVHLAADRRSLQTAPADVLQATLQLPRSLADREMQALGVDPQSVLALVRPNGEPASTPTLRQLLVSANREAEVLGHYQVDSIHLLLAMLYTDSPATAGPLQQAGLTLYDLRRHLQTGSAAGAPSYTAKPRDADLRRKPWPSLRGVFGVSPFFLGLIGLAAVSGFMLWTNALPGFTPPLTITFVVAGWIVSLCIHEFGHALVAFLGGDRSVAAAGYLSLNPLRYQNLTMSIILPIIFLLLGGVALPGGAVYINHSALRSRGWSSAVSAAGPAGTLLCGVVIGAAFTVARSAGWISSANVDFFAALALLGFFMALALVLNMLPVPGLDGFGILRPWLPYPVQYTALRYGALPIFGVFIVLWFVAPVREAFYHFVYQLAALANIPSELIVAGLLNMRFV